MSKRAKIILIFVAVLFAAVLIWLAKKNKKSIVQFETEKAFKTTIVKKDSCNRESSSFRRG